MASEHNTSYDDDEPSTPSEIAISHIVRFWIILPFYIPSLFCSLFVLYHFIFNRHLRQALHNHVITLLLFINLIVQLTSMPWTLNYYRLEYVWPQTPSFCLTWMFLEEALYITTTLLFAWATIERHILIFHDHLVATQKKFIIFHCLPVVFIILYSACYNIMAVAVPPCQNTYDYSLLLCGEPMCYYEVESVGMWDVIVNDMIPTTIIIVFSIALLVRVLYQKYRMHQRIRWRTHRKMTIQLLSISLLYLVIYIPEMLMEFVYLCGVSEDVGVEFMMYAEFITHYGNILLPFVCAGSMPELKQKMKNMILCWRPRTRAVGPETLAAAHSMGLRQLNTKAFM